MDVANFMGYSPRRWSIIAGKQQPQLLRANPQTCLRSLARTLHVGTEQHELIHKVVHVVFGLRCALQSLGHIHMSLPCTKAEGIQWLLFMSLWMLESEVAVLQWGMPSTLWPPSAVLEECPLEEKAFILICSVVCALVSLREIAWFSEREGQLQSQTQRGGGKKKMMKKKKKKRI